MDINGEIEWSRNINRYLNIRTVLLNSDHSSFFSIFDDDKSYIFFNAYKAKKLKNNRIDFKSTPKYLFASVLDKNGNLTYNQVFDDKKSEFTFLVGRGIINKNDQIFLSGYKSSSKQLLKISIP